MYPILGYFTLVIVVQVLSKYDYWILVPLRQKHASY